MNKQAEITVELNNIKYLVVEVLITSKTDSDKINSNIRKHEGIYQGIKKIRIGGFWNNTYGIFKILIPEKNIIEFNKDNY